MYNFNEKAVESRIMDNVAEYIWLHPNGAKLSDREPGEAKQERAG
jgi:hypothetical protein